MYRILTDIDMYIFLKEDIEDYFADKGFRKKLKGEGMYSRKTEKQRGRLETREYYYTE